MGTGNDPGKEYKHRSWMDIGELQYLEDTIHFNSLPPALYGADWIAFKDKKQQKTPSVYARTETDVYIGVPPGKMLPDTLKGFENTLTNIITDENGGTNYTVYRKRYPAGTYLFLPLAASYIVATCPAGNLQPAYDLKPVIQYRAAAVPLNETIQKDSVNGRYCVVINTNQAAAGFQVQTGVGDHYSFTVKYYWNKEITISGRLQLLDAGGRMMMDEPVSFSFTRPGKWNQFTLNTATMINAGNYTVRLLVKDGKGLALSSVDVQ